jgi:hypothetical protein
MSETAPNDPLEPAPPAPDIHSRDFWEKEWAGINAAFARFRALSTQEASIDDLRQFAAETIRLVIHDHRILERVCLDTAPMPKKPRKPYTRKPKPVSDPFDGHDAH